MDTAFYKRHGGYKQQLAAYDDTTVDEDLRVLRTNSLHKKQ